MVLFQQLHQTVTAWDNREGITAADVMTLPEPFSSVLRKLLRTQTLMTAVELGQEFMLSPDDARQLATLLVEKGYLRAIKIETSPELSYMLRAGQRRGTNALSTNERLLKAVES